MIRRYTQEQLKTMESETDWERVRNMRDDEIDITDYEISEEMKSLNKMTVELFTERNKRVRNLQWFYHAARKQANTGVSKWKI
jgi:hypothetical protein